MTGKLNWASLPAALALAACAGSPEPRVASTGILPTAGAYEIAETGSPAELRGLVAQHLQHGGLRAAPDADFLVQVGSYARPAAVGLFLPDVSEEQWHRSPARGRRTLLQGVIVSVTDRRSGREVYRVTAEQTVRGSKGADGLRPLLAAAFGPAQGS
ncbi:hypothetical protein GRI75_09700 [Altererythrobacter soli]|uniref:DUF4136 domain-containing protein n=1 Tax=Croceibacterium soli TaxID=1739690 RepID=A0A6I4UWJ0_9SPHN|nr:DUF4136 domain-containing protein [Croceibacterium soli]MXP41913.1 hypothetical protein [Croceibacterium soli]